MIFQARWRIILFIIDVLPIRVVRSLCKFFGDPVGNIITNEVIASLLFQYKISIFILYVGCSCTIPMHEDLWWSVWALSGLLLSHRNKFMYNGSCSSNVAILCVWNQIRSTQSNISSSLWHTVWRQSLFE